MDSERVTTSLYPSSTDFTYLQPFLSLTFFHFGWDISTTGEICGVSKENDSKRKKFEKQLHRGHFLTSFELSYVKIGSQVRAAPMARNTKKKKDMCPQYFSMWGHHSKSEPKQTWQYSWQTRTIFLKPELPGFGVRQTRVPRFDAIIA